MGAGGGRQQGWREVGFRGHSQCLWSGLEEGPRRGWQRGHSAHRPSPSFTSFKDKQRGTELKQWKQIVFSHYGLSGRELSDILIWVGVTGRFSRGKCGRERGSGGEGQRAGQNSCVEGSCVCFLVVTEVRVLASRTGREAEALYFRWLHFQGPQVLEKDTPEL